MSTQCIGLQWNFNSCLAWLVSCCLFTNPCLGLRQAEELGGARAPSLLSLTVPSDALFAVWNIMWRVWANRQDRKCFFLCTTRKGCENRNVAKWMHVTDRGDEWMTLGNTCEEHTEINRTNTDCKWLQWKLHDSKYL